MISDQEYAERYCLSEIFNPQGPDFHWLGSEVVETQEPTLIDARARQFQIDCQPVLHDPRSFLRFYNVTMVLWNEKLRPDWQIDPLLVKKIEQGEGWSLWGVTTGT